MGQFRIHSKLRIQLGVEKARKPFIQIYTWNILEKMRITKSGNLKDLYTFSKAFRCQKFMEVPTEIRFSIVVL